MPKLYISTRVSTADQEEALAQQDRTAIAYADYVCTKYPDITERFGPFRDKASAYKIPFAKRPMGRFICAALQPGDHVVFARLDRAFRMGHDFQIQMRTWQQQGIIVHFADLGIDFSTSSGRMLATIMAAVAEQYSESLSERQKLAWRERHVHGTLFPNGNKVLVKKVTRPGMQTLTVVNREAIVYLRYIVGLRRATYRRDGVPLSWEECGDCLEHARVQHGDIPEYRPRLKRQAWTWLGIRQHLTRLMKTEIPALNSKNIVAYFRTGQDPFRMTRKSSGVPHGYKHPTRQRESIVQHVRLAELPIVTKPAKRWSRQFDACVQCHKTDYEHRSHGQCVECWHRERKAAAG